MTHPFVWEKFRWDAMSERRRKWLLSKFDWPWWLIPISKEDMMSKTLAPVNHVSAWCNKDKLDVELIKGVIDHLSAWMNSRVVARIFFCVECFFFRSSQQADLNKQLSFVATLAEFGINFERRFKSALWIEAIDFGKFHVAGGCIVNSLCKEPFPDIVHQQIDISFHGNSYSDFDDAVTKVFENLKSMLLRNDHQSSATLMKKGSGVYNTILPFGVQLRFNFKDIPQDANPVSYALHGSDIDVTQVAFTGQRKREEIDYRQQCVLDRFTYRLLICFSASDGDEIVPVLHITRRYGQQHHRKDQSLLSKRIRFSRTTRIWWRFVCRSDDPHCSWREKRRNTRCNEWRRRNSNRDDHVSATWIAVSQRRSSSTPRNIHQPNLLTKIRMSMYF